MNVKNINIVRPQLLQTVSHGDMHALRRIACKITLQRLILPVVPPVSSRVLRRHDHLIPIPAFLHPLADKALRVLRIIHVGGVDEVASEREVGVHQGERVLILPEYLAPGAADAYTAQGYRGDFDGGGG